jgi:hypothetical protein
MQGYRTHHRHWDPVLLCVLNQLGAAVQVPFTPRRNDFNVRFERVVSHLKPDLQRAYVRVCVCARVCVCVS